MAKEWITVLRAADAAARWHVYQRRKGVAAEEVSVPKIRFCNIHDEVRRGQPQLRCRTMKVALLGDCQNVGPSRADMVRPE
jgi:hypothetical protein